MAAVRRVAVLAPMTVELQPFLRKLSLERRSFHGGSSHHGDVDGVEVVATLTHIGMTHARRTTERVLDAFEVDHVIVSGVAGGVGPDTKVGHLVVPDVVVDHHTGDEFVPSPLAPCEADRRGRLVVADDFIYDPEVHARFVADGVVAVDMETAAVARVCDERGVPWSVYRGISDHVDDAKDDSVLKLVRSDGSPDPKQVAAYLLRDPRRVRVLAQLARGSKVATNAAADAAIAALRAAASEL